jgi:hypothetical protein
MHENAKYCIKIHYIAFFWRKYVQKKLVTNQVGYNYIYCSRSFNFGNILYKCFEIFFFFKKKIFFSFFLFL